MQSSEPSSGEVIAYVALGANLGDRGANLRRALDLLRADSAIAIDAVSGFLENPAVGGPADSPSFLNAVAELRTTLSPRSLLDRLLEIERQFGRVRTERWGPRSLDLDLILYGSQVIRSAALTVPHPRMHERRFVLAPLAEIAPQVRHSLLGKTAAELLAGLDQGRPG